MPASSRPFEIPFAADQILIAGAWRSCAARDTLALDDPSTGREIARIARGDRKSVV